MINSTVCYILTGLVLLLAAIPCIEALIIIAKAGEGLNIKKILYITGVYLGTAIWMNLAGLLLYLQDNVYRSGIIFMSPLIIIATLCMQAGGIIKEKQAEEKREKVKKSAGWIFGAVLWLALQAFYNYELGVVLSTAFFVISSIKRMYLFLGILFAAGAFILFATSVLSDSLQIKLHRRKKKQPEKVYVPKAARNMINHKKKKKR